MVTVSKELQQTLQAAVAEARRRRHEYVTLEHLLYALLEDDAARNILFHCGADLEEIARALEDYFKKLKEKGRLPRTLDPAGASRRVFSVYEGVLQTWHLTGDASALDDMLFLSERIWK